MNPALDKGQIAEGGYYFSTRSRKLSRYKANQACSVAFAIRHKTKDRKKGINIKKKER